MDATLFTSKLLELEERFAALEPELELTVRDPDLATEGYVVVWTTRNAINSPLGRCGKGGTRITPHTTLDEIKMLARIMALKNAAAGLPLGGAKSGMRDDPESPGFEQRFRRFVQLAAPNLVERGGVFGGFGFDIGVKPEHARIACEELGSVRCFTGKSFEMGGTDYDREGIAGLGVSVSAHAALLFEKGTANDTSCITPCTFAVQGLGAMGAAIVRYFSEVGGELVAVSDPRIGGTYILTTPASGELITAISHQHWDNTRALLAAYGKPSPLDEVLYQPVDMLFPAAIQEVITSENVSRIRAKRIVEAANNPCTPSARSALHARGVLVLPDFIVNAGGVIAAYVEMSSTISVEENLKTRKNCDDAKKLTELRIRENTLTMLRLATSVGVEPCVAGRFIALSNIFPESMHSPE